MTAATGISDVGLPFDKFVNTIREDNKPIISPAKFARAFHIQLQDVATEAHVHRNTLRRHPDSPQTQRFLRDTLKVLSAVSGVQDDVSEGMYWIRNHPIPAFAHKTAWELIGEGRTNDVIAYLDSISDGFVG